MLLKNIFLFTVASSAVNKFKAWASQWLLKRECACAWLASPRPSGYRVGYHAVQQKIDDIDLHVTGRVTSRTHGRGRSQPSSASAGGGETPSGTAAARSPANTKRRTPCLN